MNQLAILLNQERIDELENRVEKMNKEQKWLGNMSKEELRKAHEEVQRELKEEKC